MEPKQWLAIISLPNQIPNQLKIQQNPVVVSIINPHSKANITKSQAQNELKHL
jgi:hypothetical protein